MDKITVESIKLELEKPNYINEDTIKSLHNGGIISSESSILLWFICKLHPKRKISNYFENAATISKELGMSEFNFNNIVASLSKKGILHRCGKKGEWSRHWTLGKQEDCKRKIKDKYCCEYKGVKPKFKDGVSKVTHLKELDNITLDDFKEYIRKSVSTNETAIIPLYISMLQEIGIDYKSIHDDYFEVGKVDSGKGMSWQQMAKYIYKNILPQIKGKSEILNNIIYPSNLFKEWDNYNKGAK
jgi:hypothetical protein